MSDYDGINLCAKCGEYTTGVLCRSCAEQESIDNDETEPMPAYPAFQVYEDDDYYSEDEYDYDDYYSDDEYEYSDGYDSWDYYPLTWRERWHYNLTHPREYLPALWNSIRYKLRYKFDKKYRNSIDEIPF